MSVEYWDEGLAAYGLQRGRPVKAEIEIDVPAKRVWGVISKEGYLKDCHPFCAETHVDRWPGLGSRDSITYHSGVRYERTFVRWLEGEGYDIEIGKQPKKTARVLWRIVPETFETCRLSIEVFPLLKAELSPERKQQYQDRLFGDVLEHYLDCVVKGVQHFATTNTPVSADQFGQNPLYSA